MGKIFSTHKNNNLPIKSKPLFSPKIITDNNDSLDKLDDFVMVEHMSEHESTCVVGNKINHTLIQPKIFESYNLIDDNPDTCILSHALFDYITKLQEHVYKYDKTGIDDVECCVCYENNTTMIPLKCAHPLCYKCYQSMLKLKNKNCPLCRSQMESVKIQKLYCTILPILKKIDDIFANQYTQTYKIPNDNTLFILYGIVIVYLPPIFDSINNMWTEKEFFYDIANDHNEKSRFINACKKIKTEKYVTLATPAVDKLLRTIFEN